MHHPARIAAGAAVIGDAAAARPPARPACAVHIHVPGTVLCCTPRPHKRSTTTCSRAVPTRCGCPSSGGGGTRAAPSAASRRCASATWISTRCAPLPAVIASDLRAGTAASRSRPGRRTVRRGLAPHRTHWHDGRRRASTWRRSRWRTSPPIRRSRHLMGTTLTTTPGRRRTTMMTSTARSLSLSQLLARTARRTF